MSEVRIREFKIEELDTIVYLQPEGWGDIKYYFKFYYDSPFCFPIVALESDRIIGLANGLKNKTTGWLSHIIVANKYRGKGIGYRLTKEVMRNLTSLGCESQLLIATELGEKVYTKLGFKTTSIYNFYIVNQLITTIDYGNIRRYESKDLEELMLLDFDISGEYREHMITKFLTTGWIYHDSRNGKLSGYFLPDLGDGVILARNDLAGIELLKLKHSLKKCKTVLPDENKDGQKFLTDNGFELQNTAKRMVWGDEVNWIPQGVFCRIGGFYG